MELLVQPRDGLEPIRKAIKSARRSLEIVIFRMDRPELHEALVEAVQRGVTVTALIAFTNRGGQKELRKLESDLLANGITVARTADDLVRYHGKMMLVDRKELYVLSFNFISLDFRSRGFGLLTRNPRLVQEAAELFDADAKRQPYRPGKTKLVVSPVNARKSLSAFLKEARKELLIYDLKVTDAEILQVLHERAKAGVKIRILGQVKSDRLKSVPFRSMRLHARAIIRDRSEAFIGSQSLRKLELDARREIGVIFRGRSAINALLRYFKKDWQENAGKSKRDSKTAIPLKKAAKKVARRVTRNLPVAPIVHQVVKAVAKKASTKRRRKVDKKLKSAMKKAVKQTVREATKEALADMVEQVA